MPEIIIKEGPFLIRYIKKYNLFSIFFPVQSSNICRCGCCMLLLQELLLLLHKLLSLMSFPRPTRTSFGFNVLRLRNTVPDRPSFIAGFREQI